MIAKSSRKDPKDYTDSLSGEVSPAIGKNSSPNQDIFVEDDPAVVNWSKRFNAQGKKNDDVDTKQKIELLRYTHQMLIELRRLTLSVDEPMVAYLIEMALLEAGFELQKKEKS